MLSNEKIHKLALIFSIVFHVVILIGVSVNYKKTDIVHYVKNTVPIDYIVKEIIIEKPKPKKVIKKQKKATPKKFAGDRKKAIVESKKIPLYPKEAINFGHEGTVVVDVYLNSKGRIVSIKIIKSTGYASLDETFIKTIKSGYIFKPKQVKGVKKKDKVRVSYTFKL